MNKKSLISSATLKTPKEVQRMDERVIMMDLPTSVHGFVFMGDDGEPVIVLNARLSFEQNRKTFRHEKRHIKNNELHDQTYKEYKEGDK